MVECRCFMYLTLATSRPEIMPRFVPRVMASSWQRGCVGPICDGGLFHFHVSAFDETLVSLQKITTHSRHSPHRPLLPFASNGTNLLRRCNVYRLKSLNPTSRSPLCLFFSRYPYYQYSFLTSIQYSKSQTTRKLTRSRLTTHRAKEDAYRVLPTLAVSHSLGKSGDTLYFGPEIALKVISHEPYKSIRTWRIPHHPSNHHHKPPVWMVWTLIVTSTSTTCSHPPPDRLAYQIRRLQTQH